VIFGFEDVRDEAGEEPVGKCRDSADDLYFECEGDKNVGI
jgi:hypothetical protein